MAIPAPQIITDFGTTFYGDDVYGTQLKINSFNVIGTGPTQLIKTTQFTYNNGGVLNTTGYLCITKIGNATYSIEFNTNKQITPTWYYPIDQAAKTIHIFNSLTERNWVYGSFVVTSGVTTFINAIFVDLPNDEIYNIEMPEIFYSNGNVISTMRQINFIYETPSIFRFNCIISEDANNQKTVIPLRQLIRNVDPTHSMNTNQVIALFIKDDQGKNIDVEFNTNREVIPNYYIESITLQPTSLTAAFYNHDHFEGSRVTFFNKISLNGTISIF